MRILCALLLAAVSLNGFAQQRYKNFQEASMALGALRQTGGPANVRWIDGGDRYAFTSGKSIKALAPKDLQEEELLNISKLTFPGSDNKPFAYQSFQWSKDNRFLLFQCNFRPVWRFSGMSDYYLYSFSDKTLRQVAKDARTAQLSPDGQKVAYERNGNLYVYDLASQKETELTHDAAEQVYNGRFGWAYEEEFGLAQAWDWSPDSRYLAFWQTDERKVPVYQMTDYSGTLDGYEKVPYPRVGNENPLVRIGVLRLSDARLQWMNVDLGDGYIPRIYWTSQPGQLAIVHLNRAQNHLRLFFADAEKGSSRQVMEEKQDTWIDVFDFFAGVNHYFFFPENTREFFWVSDRDGWNHIYHYDYNGKLLNQVTSGNWEVTDIRNIDTRNKKIYFLSTEVSPLERHLYVADFNGRNRVRLTQAQGRHAVNFSPNSKYFLDTYSNTATPRQVELRSTEGQLLKTLADNKNVSEFVSKNPFAFREMKQVVLPDGQKIDIAVVKPLGFDSTRRYPLLMEVYGGPGSQSVYNSFSGDAKEQYMADQGYVIVSVNNRGSGGYGARFRKGVYGQLGKLESYDFAEVARLMGRMPWVDSTRMAISGHSYGGFSSSYTMLTHPEVFKVSLVGAPVTDWRLYDAIYTERYMGLVPANNDQYKQSASTTHAGKLKGKMFIYHSGMDENVHLKNTMQLVKALIDAGKDADLRIYPPGNHGVAYDFTSYMLLQEQLIGYLKRNLN